MLHAKAVAYLAYTHVTGTIATHMHACTEWSTDVLCGRDFNPSTSQFTVKPELLDQVRNHPMAVKAAKYLGLGFRLSFSHTQAAKRLLRTGVHLRHTETQQEIAILPNGVVCQYVAPDGKWQYISDIERAAHCAHARQEVSVRGDGDSVLGMRCTDCGKSLGHCKCVDSHDGSVEPTCELCHGRGWL